jgi:hypothetical protein
MKYFYIFAIFLMFFGCRSEKTPGVVELDLNKLERKNSEQLTLKNVAFIKLGADSSFYIGNITKTLSRNNLFYCLDMMVTKSLFVFDDKGTLIYKINKVGKMKGEYEEPRDFDVDSKGDVYIWDNGKKKIIRYSDKGRSFKETNIQDRFWDFRVLNEHIMMLCRMHLRGNLSSNIALYDFQMRSMKSNYLPTRGIKDSFSLLNYTHHRLYSSGNTTYFYHRFSPDLYTANENGIAQKIHFKNILLPDDNFLKNAKGNPNKFFADYKYVKDITDIYENKEYLSMRLYQDALPCNLLYSKITGKATILEKIHGDANGLKIDGVANNKFYKILQGDEIQKLNINGSAYINPSNRQLLTKYKTNSNPIIMLFEIDKF